VPGATRLSTGTAIAARLTPVPCRWEDTGHDHADLDLEVVGPRLVVRRRRPGDRIVPLGMRDEKKVQDLLVDAKVPRSERDRVPIVEGPSGIVWVAGVRADERFRVGPATRTVLCLRLEGREDPDSPQR
jgi:tRNA(Ile)-lysidine synthase